MAVGLTFLEPGAFYRQIGPAAGESSRVAQTACIVIPDGSQTTILIQHRMNISAADLAAGFPTIEIVNVNNSPTSPYVPTLATHTTLTGPASTLGITVSVSAAGSILLAVATPTAAAGTAAGFMVVITRNPATPIPLP